MIDQLPDVLALHFHRLVHFGVGLRDLRSAAAAGADWVQWCSALSGMADGYAARAQDALDAGRHASAAEFGLRAAAYYHFACFKRLGQSDAAAAAAAAKCVDRYRTIAPLLQPVATRLELSCGSFRLPAYLRIVRPGAPLVVLLNGLDSCKEVELHRFGEVFLARGLNVLAVDGPGQGEAHHLAPLLPAFDAAVPWIVDEVERWKPAAIGVFGVSFGGHLAARAAALDTRIAACVSLGGFFDFDILPHLPGAATSAFRHAFHMDPREPVVCAAASVTLEPLRGRLDKPLLIVHGGNDHLVTKAQVDALAEWGGSRVTTWIVEGAEHVCTDRFPEVLPGIGDWMCSRLAPDAGRHAWTSRPLIDLSLPLDACPSERLPVHIERLDHRGGAAQMTETFGIAPGRLPDGLGWAGERVTLGTHCGTHMDAPWHYGPTCNGRPARTIDEIPVEWCCAPGVLLDLREKADGQSIEPDDLERALEAIGYELAPGDIVLIRTGAANFWGSADYPERGAGLGRMGVEFLTARGVRIVGTDAWGLDRPFGAMAADYRRTSDPAVIWPAHFAGRAAEYCQLEKLTNLDRLPAVGFTVMCFPVKVARASAGWVRVVAALDGGTVRHYA